MQGTLSLWTKIYYELKNLICVTYTAYYITHSGIFSMPLIGQSLEIKRLTEAQDLSQSVYLITQYATEGKNLNIDGKTYI